MESEFLRKVTGTNFLQQLKSNTTMLDFLMHEMRTIMMETLEDLADVVKQNTVVDHVTKRMERLHASVAGDEPMTPSDMTDVALMALTLPMLSTVVHLMSGQPWSFVAGFLAMAAPVYMINYMEHEHAHEINS